MWVEVSFCLHERYVAKTKKKLHVQFDIMISDCGLCFDCLCFSVAQNSVDLVMQQLVYPSISSFFFMCRYETM